MFIEITSDDISYLANEMKLFQQPVLEAFDKILNGANVTPFDDRYKQSSELFVMNVITNWTRCGPVVMKKGDLARKMLALSSNMPQQKTLRDLAKELFKRGKCVQRNFSINIFL